MQAQHPEMRGKRVPKKGKGVAWQAAAASAKKETPSKKSSKKAAPKKKKGKKSGKSMPKKKTSAKAPSKKSAESAPKGKSGEGSGQAGRTGSRKRRTTGDFWWAKDGNNPGLALWTKRGPGSIVRATGKDKKEYSKKKKEMGLKGQADVDLESPHKKRSEYVKKLMEAPGLSDHMTKEARIKLKKSIIAAGLATEKDVKLLKHLMDQFGAMKLSLGESSRWARTPEQVKRDFLDGMNREKYKDLKEFNQAKERIEAMGVKDFDAMMRSIEFDEDEDVLREQFGVEGSWKGAGAAKSFDEALEDILKSMV